MFEVIVIGILALAIGFLIDSNLKLRQKITKYEFEKFMGQLDRDLTCTAKQEPTFVERILQ